MSDDRLLSMVEAVLARDPALTPEQLERREWVARRAKAIQAGVRPADGVTFGSGKVKKS